VRGEVGGEMHPVGDAAGCGLSWMLAAECGGEWRPVLLLGRLCDYGPGLIPNTAHFPLGGQGLLMLRKKPQVRRKKKQVTSYYKFDRSYILLLPLETWLFNLKPIESMSCAEQD
jgi:hypothetical protein